METGNKGTYITQSIGTNNGTANAANGNIQSINNISQSDSQDIIKLVESLKALINNQHIDADIKEAVVDDLETIEEQINNEEPKNVKLKKANQGIKNFISKIPAGLGQAALIITQLHELGQKLKPLIENLS